MDYVSGSVWVFNSPKRNFSGGIFREQEDAVRWIKKHALTGVLTRYPLDTGVYDWAIEQGNFTPKSDHQRSPEFIGGFTSASQDHFHFENGDCPHI